MALVDGNVHEMYDGRSEADYGCEGLVWAYVVFLEIPFVRPSSVCCT